MDIVEISDSQMKTWINTNNPKLNYYQLLPEKPQDNAIWNEGNWIIPKANTITPRQIRLWLVRNGYSLSLIEDAINGIGFDAIIEWEYAQYIDKANPMVVALATQLGIDREIAFSEAALL